MNHELIFDDPIKSLAETGKARCYCVRKGCDVSGIVGMDKEVFEKKNRSIQESADLLQNLSMEIHLVIASILQIPCKGERGESK